MLRNRLIGMISFVLVLTMGWAGAQAETGGKRISSAVIPLARAHAHNDYEHERPLLDALANGFCSVEADVHLVDGELLVAHDRDKVSAHKTLEALYLKPLQQRIKTNGGQVYQSPMPFYLMIDFKTAGEPTYKELKSQLATYADMLTVVKDGQVHRGPVTVVISGNRPRALMLNEKVRYAGYDGRLSDLDSDLPAHFMPWISDNASRITTWRGQGPLPEADIQRIDALVEQVHGKGRKFRLWGTPDTPTMWQVLNRAKVDFINTDDLTGLRDYLLGCASEGKGGTPAFKDILKIDVHAHIFEEMPEFMDMMDRINLHMVNVCVRGTQPELLEPMERQAEFLYKNYPKYFTFASTYDLTRRHEPDYAQQVCAWLDKSYAAGALMTKVWKDVGMEIKTASGDYVMPDDPIFDPIYRHIEKNGKPLLAHLAEPIAAWLPLDPENPHYGYYSTHPEWHVYQKKGFPSHEEILAARDRLLERYPQLILIGAHCGSMSHDVDEIAKRMDRYPNFYIDVSARTKDLAFQPAAKVRSFFLQYQDRILYGVDLGRAHNPDEPSSHEDRLRFAQRTEERYRQEFQFYAGSGTVRFNQRECDSEPVSGYCLLLLC